MCWVMMKSRLGSVAIYIYENVRVCEGLLIWVRESVHTIRFESIRGNRAVQEVVFALT